MRRTLLTLVALLPATAQAHHFMDGGTPQTLVEGLLSGLGHPVIGVDHAAFIFVAGFLLALVNRGLWSVAALVAGSLAGAALHLAGVDLVFVEEGVAVSVIVVGVLLVMRQRLGLAWMVGGMAVAGVLHGHAYAETIFGAEAAPLGAYLVGFSIMQLALASGAWWLHRRLTAARTVSAPALVSSLGGVAGLLGAVFLVLNLAV